MLVENLDTLNTKGTLTNGGDLTISFTNTDTTSTSLGSINLVGGDKNWLTSGVHLTDLGNAHTTTYWNVISAEQKLTTLLIEYVDHPHSKL